MPLSIHSTIQEILADERAKGILERHMPGATSHPDLAMAMQLTLQQVSYYPEAAQAGLTQDKLTAIDAELKALA